MADNGKSGSSSAKRKHADRDAGSGRGQGGGERGQGGNRGGRRGAGQFGKRPKRKRQELRSGLVGFLMTTQNIRDDRRCINECYSLLNKAEEELRQDNDDGHETKDAASTAGQSIEDLLQQEIDELSKPDAMSRASSFNEADVGCKGMMFIVSDSPVECRALSDAIYNKAIATSGGICRFIQRFLPVQITCRAAPDVIAKTVRQLLEHSPLSASSPQTTFKVHFKSRYNSTLKRDTAISEIGQMLLDTAPQHKADMKNPAVVISLEVIKNVCCVSVLENFMARSRYNLSETSRKAEDKRHAAEDQPPANLPSKEKGEQAGVPDDDTDNTGDNAGGKRISPTTTAA
ncbi:hypothetical protein PTSG_05706 [Salpingoeca rosetta]|uniref:THUMP domain-containing protein n=1 Tax=Salpingoeca rosetta (strain ATCC 50818 / BSB-021) TaxID=946362 RepID=F2UAZ5_SALR5|nr:uncharacterized protein PTSG_05706 [Salpingoeca rosetta]EGD74008.1 hypothetical protein PTSG_05706 [Salpingoeca rosetta]|eukprot:XP_004993571.1 hypothetical protein PTSG_05706 [Salpingoeca rosetta]